MSACPVAQGTGGHAFARALAPKSPHAGATLTTFVLQHAGDGFVSGGAVELLAQLCLCAPAGTHFFFHLWTCSLQSRPWCLSLKLELIGPCRLTPVDQFQPSRGVDR